MATLNDTLVAKTPPLRWAEGGKVLRVGQTRVPLDTVVRAYEEGATPEEIVHSFPALQVADVYAVIAYYLQNREEVENYLEQRRRVTDELRAESERRFPSADFRQRLLIRQQQQRA